MRARLSSNHRRCIVNCACGFYERTDAIAFPLQLLEFPSEQQICVKHATTHSLLGWTNSTILRQWGTKYAADTFVCPVDERTRVHEDSVVLMVADLVQDKRDALRRATVADTQCGNECQPMEDEPADVEPPAPPAQNMPPLCIVRKDDGFDGARLPMPKNNWWTTMNLLKHFMSAYATRHCALACLARTKGEAGLDSAITAISALPYEFDCATLAMSVGSGRQLEFDLELLILKKRLESNLHDEYKMHRWMKREFRLKKQEMYQGLQMRMDANVNIPRRSRYTNITLRKLESRRIPEALRQTILEYYRARHPQKQDPVWVIEAPFEMAPQSVKKRDGSILWQGNLYVCYADALDFLLDQAKESWKRVEAFPKQANEDNHDWCASYFAHTIECLGPISRRFSTVGRRDGNQCAQRSMTVEECVDAAPLCLLRAVRSLKYEKKLFHDGRLQLAQLLLDLGFAATEIADIVRALVGENAEIDPKTLQHVQAVALSEMKQHPQRKRRCHSVSCSSMLGDQYKYKTKSGGCPYQTMAKYDVKGLLCGDLILGKPGSIEERNQSVAQVMNALNALGCREACKEHLNVKCYSKSEQTKTSVVPRSFFYPHEFVRILVGE